MSPDALIRDIHSWAEHMLIATGSPPTRYHVTRKEWERIAAHIGFDYTRPGYHRIVISTAAGEVQVVVDPKDATPVTELTGLQHFEKYRRLIFERDDANRCDPIVLSETEYLSLLDESKRQARIKGEPTPEKIEHITTYWGVIKILIVTTPEGRAELLRQLGEQ